MLSSQDKHLFFFKQNHIYLRHQFIRCDWGLGPFWLLNMHLPFPR